MTLQDPITFLITIFLGRFVQNTNQYSTFFILFFSFILIYSIDPSSIFIFILGFFLILFSRRGDKSKLVIGTCILLLIFYKSEMNVWIINIFEYDLISYILIGDVNKGGVIPSGISFFLLTICIFTLKANNKEPISKIFATATFFPHVLAGPILFRTLQIDTRFKLVGPGYAALLFCMGMFLLSSSEILNQLFNGTRIESVSNGYLTSWIFYLYLFSNFFGYSLLATAYAMLFGIEIPINFNAPSLAINPSDFWLRWHRSLSLLFRNYLFKWLLNFKIQATISIMLVMSLSGLWHGWGVGFLIWGVLNGMLIIAAKLIESKNILKAVTFFLMPATWVPFFSKDINQLIDSYRNFFYLGIATELFSIKYLFIIFAIILISITPYAKLLSPFFVVKYSTTEPYGQHNFKFIGGLKESLISVFGGAMLALVCYYGIGVSGEFMYQRF